jgi:hypothetical protein
MIQDDVDIFRFLEKIEFGHDEGVMGSKQFLGSTDLDTHPVAEQNAGVIAQTNPRPARANGRTGLLKAGIPL